MRSLSTCLARMRNASWSRILFGDDPYLVLTFLLIAGLVFYPLLSDVWAIISVLLALAAAVHVWLWCREHEADGVAAGQAEDEGGPT